MLAEAELRQLVTRNVLTVVSEGVPRLVTPSVDEPAFGDGCLALPCGGGELTATVRLERHDSEPDPPPAPWQPLGQGRWHLTSGHVGVGNIEGLLDWLPDLGLAAGTWNARVSTSGREEADALQEQLLDDESIDVADWPDGPERFLVQLWP